MPEIKEVKPSYNGIQEASARYFYSEYDPATHFEYKIPFLEDGLTIDEIELNRDYDVENHKKGGPKLVAYQKAMEHHFSFEQILPKEADDFIKLYRPKLALGELSDFNYDFTQITEENFDNNWDSILQILPTKSAQINEIAQVCDLDTKDYSEMTYAQLQEMYDEWQEYLESHPQYINATKKNQHCYECALYCRIKRPYLLDSNGNLVLEKDDEGNIIVPNQYAYVSPYEFRRILRLVNQVFNFKLPVEEGWYKYSKATKRWEFITFKQEG